MLSITCDRSELAEGLKLIFDIQGLPDVMLHNTIYFLTDKGNRPVPGVPDWAAWIAFLKMGTMSATLLTNHFFLVSLKNVTMILTCGLYLLCFYIDFNALLSMYKFDITSIAVISCTW